MYFMLVIVCPKNKSEVPTGIVVDITTFREMPVGISKLRCPSCGDEHTWAPADAQLASLSLSEQDKIRLPDDSI
jgi:hypothetical protein